MTMLKARLQTLASSFASDVVRTIQASSVDEVTSSGEYAKYMLTLCAPFLEPSVLEELKTGTAAPPATAASGSSRLGIKGLFGSDTTKFLKDHWPNAYFLKTDNVARLAGLVDHEFDALVRMKKSYTRAFFRTSAGSTASMDVAPGQERALYEAGFTVYFHSLRFPAIDAWIDAIEKDLGLLAGVTRVSAFASRRGKGLDGHYDQNDNFICQARGTKRWRVAPNTHVKNPTVGYAIGTEPNPRQLAEAPGGFPSAFPEPSTTVETSPGTVMLLPRGTWHETETVSEASLHFNIQTGFAAWADAIEFLLLNSGALYGENFRAAMKAEFTADHLRPNLEAELKDKLVKLAESIAAGKLPFDRHQFERFVANKRNSVSD